jgi:antirestriction protein ArdC
MSNSDSLYSTITDQIIGMLAAPSANNFELPWRRSAGLSRALNAATGRPYQGVNILLLWARSLDAGYTSGYFATYRQWVSLGAQVRRGEKAATIVFYKGQPVRDAGPEGSISADGSSEADGASRRLVARASAVFAAEQVDGFTQPIRPTPNPVECISTAARFITATGATFIHGGDRAFYRPSTDAIHLPHVSAFIGSSTSSPTEAYYSTALHELIHFTSPPHRCDRELGKRFGDAAYCIEELIAELGSAFLSADLQIAPSPRADHAHYLANWLAVLRSDNKAIFTAASKASQAAAYLHGLQPSDPIVSDRTREGSSSPAAALSSGYVDTLLPSLHRSFVTGGVT